MTHSPRTVLAVAVTRDGAGVARRLCAGLPGGIAAVPARFAEAGERGYEGSVRSVIESGFRGDSALVLVMATGIAVRLLAPLLGGKRSDPPVVVVDDGGRFAISLLSGHLGGANALTEQVASVLGALPVITTASEAAGLPALDRLERDLGWRLDPASRLTAVTATLVNGDPVGLVQECGSRDWLIEPRPANLTEYSSYAALTAAQPAAAIVISDRLQSGWPAERPLVLYRPPTLVVGAGTSRSAPAEELQALVERAISAGGLAQESLCAIATIDVKRTEPAVLALAGRFGVPLLLYTAEQLDTVAGRWTPSEVVQRAVGTRGVCEPAALLAAGSSTLLVAKQKSAHATVAIARLAPGRRIPFANAEPATVSEPVAEAIR